MSSPIFGRVARGLIEGKVAKLINRRATFLSTATAGSPRAAGDAIQSIIEGGFEEILGEHGGEYSAKFARRAMADMAFKDALGNYYVVDVKTHRLGTAFNMPNLTSVERLARFYEDDTNFFALLIVKYTVKGTRVRVSQVHFVPIEFLKWDCLTLGALGWGQIQIANARYIEIDSTKSRRSWMLEFCDTVLAFYPREIEKTKQRIARFERLKRFWTSKAE